MLFTYLYHDNKNLIATTIEEINWEKQLFITFHQLIKNCIINLRSDMIIIEFSQLTEQAILGTRR